MNKIMFMKTNQFLKKCVYISMMMNKNSEFMIVSQTKNISDFSMQFTLYNFL